MGALADPSTPLAPSLISHLHYTISSHTTRSKTAEKKKNDSSLTREHTHRITINNKDGPRPLANNDGRELGALLKFKGSWAHAADKP
ncbi:hypothetical protein JTE90_010674 [Oedothorax gibbosus]|uniref:Uncharacterized protein n=1 Tax=Oedothorax gibbosus TaxID=931172 RepID=A0AAV6UQP6_9ARAC|nr:hypothetical protein JTE90_010674 [Oedothorax gibbosus]